MTEPNVRYEWVKLEGVFCPPDVSLLTFFARQYPFPVPCHVKRDRTGQIWIEREIDLNCTCEVVP